MVGRVPCGVCHQQSSSPNNFLLVCACGEAFHHRCLEPPMAQSILLAMIDAFNRNIHERSIRSWQCATCMGIGGTLNQSRLPVFIPQTSTLGDELVRRRPTDHHKMPSKSKTITSRRAQGWHVLVPKPGMPSQHKPRMPHKGSSSTVWPPVRHKKKFQTHPAIAKDSIRESYGSPVEAASAMPIRKVFTKPFVKSNPPTLPGPGPKPKPAHLQTSDLPPSIDSTSLENEPSNIKRPVDGTPTSSCRTGQYPSMQTTLAKNNHHIVPLAIDKDIPNHPGIGTKLSKEDNSIIISDTLPTDDGGVKDVFMDNHRMIETDSKHENTIQFSLSVPPSSSKGLFNLPSSPTASRGSGKRKRQPDVTGHPIRGINASLTSSVSTPPSRELPFIDLSKVMKRKRSIVERKPSVTSFGSNSHLSGWKGQVGVSRQDSAFEGFSLGFSLKRRKLELDNGEEQGMQNPNGPMDAMTAKERNVVIAAEDKHTKPDDTVLSSLAQTDEHIPEFSVNDRAKRRKLDVQTHLIELSHQQLHSSKVGSAHPDTNQTVHDETNLKPQLASPATSHRSIVVPSRDCSLPIEDQPDTLPPTLLSPPREILPIHGHECPESHQLPPTMLTPRSLSPPHHKNRLEHVVARLRQRPRDSDQIQPSKPPQSSVKIPRLAKWFREVGTTIVATKIRDKRRRWKTSSTKATMDGLNEGWTFVGPQVRTSR